ncbi:hypothetical protein [Rhodoferax sp.]|uniref:hypothetical protein n=1 Tax=Rhodoferax sp. TaxID=50421 RepID=UPI0026241954|nr:hypothetical protein [Rhodoferax sp.]MDD2917946.1 hypothetical protein [Rhodoferax sp.]
MSKGMSSFRRIRRLKAMWMADKSALQLRSLDGRFAKEEAKEGAKPAAVVVIETRQQRRYKALQATKNPLPLVGQGDRS